MEINKIDDIIKNGEEESLDTAKKAAYSSIDYGIKSIEELNTQKETLNHINRTLESNEIIIDKSLKKVRAFTWSGYLYNQYESLYDTIGFFKTKELELIEKERNNPNKKNQEIIQNRVIKNEINRKKEELFKEQENTTNNNKTDNDLDEISKALTILCDLSLLMGENIEKQNTDLKQMEEKSDHINNKTLNLTLKTSQLTSLNVTTNITKIGQFKFVEMESGYYLSVHNQKLILSKQNDSDKFIYFNCYNKNNENIIGIQNDQTGCFIGSDFLGNIIVQSNIFGKYEECYACLDGNETGILILIRNWGAGGWLSKDPVSKVNQLTNHTPHNNYINQTTDNITNKKNMFVFIAIQVSNN